MMLICWTSRVPACSDAHPSYPLLLASLEQLAMFIRQDAARLIIPVIACRSELVSKKGPGPPPYTCRVALRCCAWVVERYMYIACK
jgi:hypothetical protein